tara:strand:- start:1098 stop:1271 length:174 start_codon:yes stop_codon:yes gene_type:complete
MTTKESFLREINYDGLMPKPKRESKHNDLYEKTDIDPELYDDFENPSSLTRLKVRLL